MRLLPVPLASKIYRRLAACRRCIADDPEVDPTVKHELQDLERVREVIMDTTLVGWESFTRRADILQFVHRVNALFDFVLYRNPLEAQEQSEPEEAKPHDF